MSQPEQIFKIWNTKTKGYHASWRSGMNCWDDLTSVKRIISYECNHAHKSHDDFEIHEFELIPLKKLKYTSEKRIEVL